MGNQNGGIAKDNLEGRDVRQLDQHVSAALAKGVKYNMKILIRGQVRARSIWVRYGNCFWRVQSVRVLLPLRLTCSAMRVCARVRACVMRVCVCVCINDNMSCVVHENTAEDG